VLWFHVASSAGRCEAKASDGSEGNPGSGDGSHMMLYNLSSGAHIGGSQGHRDISEYEVGSASGLTMSGGGSDAWCQPLPSISRLSCLNTCASYEPIINKSAILGSREEIICDGDGYMQCSLDEQNTAGEEGPGTSAATAVVMTIGDAMCQEEEEEEEEERQEGLEEVDGGELVLE
jgi:hypothetical protein